MSSIADALLHCLRSVERSGDFCVGGLREIFMPAIDVEGVGRVAFPVPAAQAGQLVAVAEPAPHGRGEKTVVDRDVRRTWQIDPGRVRIGGLHWETTLAELVTAAARGLGVEEPVAADFYKLLLYDEGSFFLEHRDTEKIPGMFATLVIVLPSAHSGGDLVVRHLGREVTFDLRPEEPSEIGFAAFYADCVHEVRPVVAGHRLILVYNLRFLTRRRQLRAPDHRAVEANVADLLRGWRDAEDEPDKLIVPLEHAYTPAELSFDALKGVDAGVAAVLVEAAAETDCDLHLALASIEESGSAQYTGYYGRRRWDREAEGDENFEVSEIFDRWLTLSEWRRPDGGKVGFQDFPFDEDELCPPDAFEDLTPDEQHFHEATGNEGASFDRSYRRAGLVLWPRARRLAVLNQAGLGATLPHLEDLAGRWQTGEGSFKSEEWREADELSGHMLRSWSPDAWRKEGDTDAGRMLDLQVRLRNVARIDEFLADLSANGHYAASDNEAIIRAVTLLPQPRATELLVAIVRRNAAAHLGGCGDLLLRRVAAPADSAGDAAQVGSALVDVLPGDPARRDRLVRPVSVKPDFVVDLLTATSKVDARLAVRAVEHLLTWPETYPPDAVLVPAALALSERAGSWPAAGRLREASLDHLCWRIAQPLEPPRDWSRTNPLKCSCADCRELGAFMIDAHQRQWRLKAAQERRSHVEGSVRNNPCDIDLATERRGSPHTLIATKNQATYERRAKQRRKDLEHVSALGGCGSTVSP